MMTDPTVLNSLKQEQAPPIDDEDDLVSLNSSGIGSDFGSRDGGVLSIDNRSVQTDDDLLGGGSGHNKSNNNKDNTIAYNNTLLVNRSKWIVYLVILISATVAGGLTYHYVNEANKRWYEDEVSFFDAF